MAARGISFHINDLIQRVKKTGTPQLMKIEDFYEQFGVDIRDKSVEDIERIQDWLQSRKVIVEPDISSSPPNAIISIKSKPAEFNNIEAQEKLQRPQ